MKRKIFEFILRYLLLSIIPFFSLYADPIQIMPLGDSITHGWESIFKGYSTGYRNDLWYKLKKSNFNINFVGSQNNGYLVTPSFDSDHEGYGGYKTYDIANIVYPLLVQNPPDIILLHIGSNDVSPEQGLNSSSISGLNQILNQIDSYEEDYSHPITVILATIINRRSYHQTVTNYNINLRNLASTRIQNGDDIVLVDMEINAGLTATDFADTTHPNSTGYSKMSNVWFTKLGEILPQYNYSYLIAINSMLLN